ncbi:poly(glycerol-phosphate) alpha-glucosyltransferase [Staphylococcus caeli]|uniref:Poly (Glycerol-phosphate) alpha-glucosyltransferase n=1 Tax=Staphylococcus caeli TaxID=2201815 RepID=A0A1D4MSK6_9STAP|nr:poly(glycerol-phosphate) alpha-glucosyltransferase [Staphylococcus caeli]SCS82911.1 poly (glycerol-phosphate) alpha-glucosyltransferase [Staphylococcus caeli]SCT01423.1 poly (glycerol-phosphate) alpha-glucosyltransferase [Staphylococcus caeli]
MSELNHKIEQLIKVINEETLSNEAFFLSLGKPNMKAIVILIKRTTHLKRDILKHCQRFKKQAGVYPKWIKIDLITETKQVLYDDIINELINTRRNYIDFGIALDTHWNMSFLPDEINANAFVRPSKNKSELILSEVNINNYLKKYTKHKKTFQHKQYHGKYITQFYTKGFIHDNYQVYKLNDRGSFKNLRIVDDLNTEINHLIQHGSDFLEGMLQGNGKYHYGYFPHFDKQIDFYNNLRHSSSTYALLESMQYLNKEWLSAKNAIFYIINNYLYEVDDKGYIYDDTKQINEIKLGQNAAFIFAVCEYLKLNPNDTHALTAAQKVAQGILAMIDSDTGETIHVLNYPDLSIKEKHRIVYYDGEAALALLRLYQINQDQTLLNAVKKLFNHFIANNYWQYHDHWLGYCTNELVNIIPDEKYYRFGIKNVNHYLDYIKHRDTTYPTFLEMLMATYYLIKNAKNNGYGHIVTELIDEQAFIETIHFRANYQRTGFFYPEIAMYFKNPQRILNSFFIKHHGYRVRIDDIEHYLSGYIQYQNAFSNKGSS